MLVTKFIRPVVKVIDAKSGRIHAIVSTEDEDRSGDVVRASGWNLEHFMAHPVLLASHNYAGSLRSQIGEWEGLEVKGRKLQGDARYYIGEGNEEADWGFNLASKGRAAYSVGFMPDPEKTQPREKGVEYKGQELLEISHVIIPSNRAALTKALAMVDPIVKRLAAECPDCGHEPDEDTMPNGKPCDCPCHDQAKGINLDALTDDVVARVLKAIQSSAIKAPEEQLIRIT